MRCLFLCTGLFPLALCLQASSLLCVAGFPSFLKVNNIPLDFPDGSAVKNLPLRRCLIPGSGRSPGEGNGNRLQCSCLENPRDGEPGGLPSMGSHRVGHDWNELAAAAAAAAAAASTLAWEIPWIEESGGCKRFGHDLVTKQQQQIFHCRYIPWFLYLFIHW